MRATLTSGSSCSDRLYEHSGSSIFIVAVWHALLNMVSATKGAEGVMAVVVSATAIGWAIALLRSDAAATPLTAPSHSSRA